MHDDISAPPSDFAFPYDPPWPIQQQFMKSLYAALDQGKVAVFESPTGTGKSLSLICGALTWLRNFQEKEEAEATSSAVNHQHSPINPTPTPTPHTDDDDEPDWLREYTRNTRVDKALSHIKSKQEERHRWDNLIKSVSISDLDVLPSSNRDRDPKRRKRNHIAIDASTDVAASSSSDFLVDDYGSKQGGNLSTYNALIDDDDWDHHDQLDAVKPKSSSRYYSNLDQEDVSEHPKIFYCSRTHSQISQFTRELKKTRFADSVKIVSLGSRKNLCINKTVTSMGSVSRMNDKCLDMQAKGNKKCEYLQKDEKLMESFQAALMQSVKDIEDIALFGKTHGICPYYGARGAVKPVEIVTLPYNLILQKSAREALKIDLKGSVLILDEAHNVADQICDIYTVSLSRSQIKKAGAQLDLYLGKYFDRMCGKNQMYIKQLQYLIQRLIAFTEPGSQKSQQMLKSTQEFVNSLNIDNINIFKLQEYLKTSRLAQKLCGFSEFLAANNVVVASSANTKLVGKLHPPQQKPGQSLQPQPESDRNVFLRFESFLDSLVNSDYDGRILMSMDNNDKGEVYIKYLLLNPAQVFAEIIQETRAIILAGGTMSPLSDFKMQLIPDLPEERFHHFSCGHIVPHTSIQTTVLRSGPSGEEFHFTYEKRSDPRLMDELGNAVIGLCNVIPGGVVCFFPSYGYMQQVYDRWQKQGIITRMSVKKAVFCEPRNASEVDSVLEKYSSEISFYKGNQILQQRPQLQQQQSQQVSRRTGAIILCVVSGKLSEGINFSDDLGRGVIMVGLPFANSASLELKEKLDFLKKKSGTQENNNEMYENMTMRAVNQSIGRAIRHKDDYATVILLDKRFNQSRIKQKLPQWIQDAHIDSPEGFAGAMQLSRKERAPQITDLIIEQMVQARIIDDGIKYYETTRAFSA